MSQHHQCTHDPAAHRINTIPRDLAGTGEADPICRLMVLEDTDADLWQVDAPAAGAYEVAQEFSMDLKNAGNSWQLESDLPTLEGKVPSTGGFDKFTKRVVGTIKLKKGTNRILMRAVQGLKGGVD